LELSVSNQGAFNVSRVSGRSALIDYDFVNNFLLSLTLKSFESRSAFSDFTSKNKIGTLFTHTGQRRGFLGYLYSIVKRTRIIWLNGRCSETDLTRLCVSACVIRAKRRN